MLEIRLLGRFTPHDDSVTKPNEKLVADMTPKPVKEPMLSAAIPLAGLAGQFLIRWLENRAHELKG
jgi:hypothetical protein